MKQNFTGMNRAINVEVSGYCAQKKSGSISVTPDRSWNEVIVYPFGPVGQKPRRQLGTTARVVVVDSCKLRRPAPVLVHTLNLQMADPVVRESDIHTPKLLEVGQLIHPTLRRHPERKGPSPGSPTEKSYGGQLAVVNDDAWPSCGSRSYPGAFRDTFREVTPP